MKSKPADRNWMGEEAAWFAKILEQLGCIGIHRFNVGKSFVLRISIGTTDEALIQRIHAAAGVGRIGIERRKPQRCNLYRWTVESRNALAVLERLWDHLTSKQAHVEVARMFYKGGVCTRGRLGFTKEQKIVRERCYARMHELNLRGKEKMEFDRLRGR